MMTKLIVSIRKIGIIYHYLCTGKKVGRSVLVGESVVSHIVMGM